MHVLLKRENSFNVFLHFNDKKTEVVLGFDMLPVFTLTWLAFK